MSFTDLMNNYVLWVAVIAWLSAQLLKVLFYGIKHSVKVFTG